MCFEVAKMCLYHRLSRRLFGLEMTLKEQQREALCVFKWQRCVCSPPHWMSAYFYKAQLVPAPDTPMQMEGKGAPELFNRRSVRTRYTTNAPTPAQRPFLLEQLRPHTPCSWPSLHVDLFIILRTLRWLLIAQLCTFLRTA